MEAAAGKLRMLGIFLMLKKILINLMMMISRMENGIYLNNVNLSVKLSHII